MGKTFIKVGLFIFVVIFMANTKTSFGVSTGIDVIDDLTPSSSVSSLAAKQVDALADTSEQTEAVDRQEQVKPKAAKKAVKKVKPIKYTVASGDNLTTIAKSQKTTWERLFYKNKQITNPDTINVGDVLIIPTATEKLAKRALSSAGLPPASTTTTVNPTQAQAASQGAAPANYAATAQPQGSSSGNTYAPGYCTWYVKNRRPDLPNMLGNANSWVSSAAARGLATGSAPRAGAVGQQGNHVVYVEKVNSNGTVLISEMNYGGGLFVKHSRTVPAGNFTYIY